MIYEVTLAGRTRRVEVSRQGEGWQVRVDGGAPRDITTRQRGGAWWLTEGRDTRRVDLHLDGERVATLADGTPRLGTVVDPRAHALDAALGGGEGAIVTQMPGAVVRVPVAVGSAVHAGEVLVVVEAMKMENEFKAPFGGVVSEVRVEAGQAVDAGAVLVVLDPAP